MASRANLGPLTTTFTPPASCTLAAGDIYLSSNVWALGQSCTDGLLHDNTNCWPSATITPTALYFTSFGFYSPGLVCPSGYWSACGTAQSTDNPVLGILTRFDPEFSILPDETAIGCCPSGFVCSAAYTQRYQTCLRFLGSGASGALNIGTCTMSTSLKSVQVPVGTGTSSPIIDNDGNTIMFAITQAAIFAPLVQLVYRASDLSSQSFSATTSVSSLSTTTLSTVPMIAPATNAAQSHTLIMSSTAMTAAVNQSASSSGSSLSRLEIGLTIGFSISILLVIMTAVYVITSHRRRRQSSRRYQSERSSNSLGEQGTQYIHFQSSPIEKCAAKKVHLLPDTQIPAELHGVSP